MTFKRRVSLRLRSERAPAPVDNVLPRMPRINERQKTCGNLAHHYHISTTSSPLLLSNWACCSTLAVPILVGSVVSKMPSAVSKRTHIGIGKNG